MHLSLGIERKREPEGLDPLISDVRVYRATQILFLLSSRLCDRAPPKIGALCELGVSRWAPFVSHTDPN